MATVQYEYPVGGTVAPTVIQAADANSVVAAIVFGDTDTSAIVTHNFAVVQPYILPAFTSIPVAATAVFPLVWTRVSGSSVGTSVLFTPTFIEIALTNSVAITISKPSQVGSNMTLQVIVLRPFSGMA